MALRLLLVDDHPAIRRGIAGLLNRERNLRIVGEAATAREALKLALQLQPNLVLLDIDLPEGNGLDVCEEIRRRDPFIQVLILSAFHDKERAVYFALLNQNVMAIEPDANACR
jgi:two-component system response regulator DevR